MGDKEMGNWFTAPTGVQVVPIQTVCRAVTVIVIPKRMLFMQFFIQHIRLLCTHTIYIGRLLPKCSMCREKELHLF